MNQAPTLSVVIGSYNQREVLRRVLEGYNAQSLTADHFEVIVVDSSSSDGSDDMMASFQANFNFRFFVQENNGKTKARNRGVAEALGRIIVITDSDMIPHEDFLLVHYNAHKAAKADVCFEGLTYNMRDLEWPPSQEQLRPYIERKVKSGQKLGWYYFLTGNISFPRSLFDAYRGFDETFQGYGWEDLELGYRMFQDGVPLYYLPEAINYHFHVISSDEEIKRNIKKGESARIFLKKHPELKLFLGLNPLSTLVHGSLSKESWIYRRIEENAYKSQWRLLHKFGFWFLKEFHYLDGLLGVKQHESE